MAQQRFGWVRSVRKSKDLLFVNLFDGQREFQATLGASLKPDDLAVGCSVLCTGESGLTPTGQYEFVCSELKVLGTADATYPIQPKKHTMDFLRTVPELRGKTRTFQTVFRTRHIATQLFHRFLDEQAFTQYFTPILTQSDCEGAGETFAVETDAFKAELTVSGQLHGEVGAMALGRIYTFSPCFRAEKSHTKKHLSEFWMWEPEMVMFDLRKTMDFAEHMVKTVILGLVDRAEETKVDVLKLTALTAAIWKRIRYSDVVAQFGIEHGEDISSEKEKEIVDHFGVPVFITHYPKRLKPFYMATEGEYAKCFDLIFPEVGELIGGSERETDYDTLVERMKETGIDADKMDWYLATRKYGSVQHSGFGLGFERFLMFVCDTQKIHDTIPFPVSA